MSRHLAGSDSSVWDISQLRHSNAYRSGNPPKRGVFRARRIGWAQRGQRGATGTVLSEPLVGMSKTSCFAPRIVGAMSWLARSILRTQGFDGSSKGGRACARPPLTPSTQFVKTTAQATGRDRRPHALPSGTATNLVASPIFTRIRTACLPWVTGSGRPPRDGDQCNACCYYEEDLAHDVHHRIYMAHCVGAEAARPL